MEKKIREGVTVQELENFGKKYKIEFFLILYLLFATLLAFLFFGPAWSLFLAGIGGIVGVWIPHKVEAAVETTFRFVFQQEKVTRLILAIAGLLVSFFLPPVTFLTLGLMGGAKARCGAQAASRKGDTPQGPG